MKKAFLSREKRAVLNPKCGIIHLRTVRCRRVEEASGTGAEVSPNLYNMSDMVYVELGQELPPTTGYLYECFLQMYNRTPSEGEHFVQILNYH